MDITARAPVTMVGIADGERQPGRLGPVGAGLVDELELWGHGVQGQVDGDVGQADAHEADPLAGQLARSGRDHHLAAAPGCLGTHGICSMSV